MILIIYLLVFSLYAQITSSLYTNCLKPIDSNSKNIVSNKLKFDFVQITATAPIQGLNIIVSQEHAYLNDAITSYEDECILGCQKLAYFKINVSNTTPAYDPTLSYGFKISGINTENFNEIIGLFSLFLQKTDLGVSDVGLSFVHGGIYIVFPIGYNFDDQMIIISYLADATAVKFEKTTIDSIDVCNASLTCDFLMGDDYSTTYTSLMFIFPFELVLKSFFTDYNTNKTITGDLFNKYKATMNDQKTIPNISSNDMTKIFRISQVNKSRSVLAGRCNKSYNIKTCSDIKTLMQRHCSFVSSTIKCLSSLSRCNSQCNKLNDICKSSNNPLSVFIASLLLISTDIKSSISASSSVLFDSIVGYNPYSLPCSKVNNLYLLDSHDIKNIEATCYGHILNTQSNNCDSSSVALDILESELVDSSNMSEFSDENIIVQDSDNTSEFASKYKARIAIISIVSIVVVASAYTYAYVM